MSRLRNQKGMSLVQSMIAVGVMGGLALMSAKIMDNMAKSNSSLQTKMDESSLIQEIALVVQNPQHCRVSLAGPGPAGSPTNPVTFKKSSADEPDKTNEGLDIAFYFADQTGEGRARKLVNGDNLSPSNPSDDLSIKGAVKVKSIKLYFPNTVNAKNPSVKNYPDSANHTDIGEIRVLIERKGKSDIMKRYSLDLSLSTSAGVTTIKGCDTAEDNEVSFQCPNKPSTHCRTGFGSSKKCPATECTGQNQDKPFCYWYKNTASHAGCREHGASCEKTIEACTLVKN